MNDDQNDTRKNQKGDKKQARIGFLEKVAKGLGEKPAYLLYLGVSFLAMGGGSSLGVYGAVKNSTVSIIAGSVIAVIALFCCVVVVFLGEKKATGSLGLDPVANVDFAPIFSAIQRNLNACFKYSHPVFQESVREECEQFQSATSHWAEGKLVVSQRSYNQLLVKVYERSEKNVFATSTPNSFHIWQNHLGAEILKAHSRSKVAKTTRVFIFDSLENVTNEHLEEMKKQQELGKIDVRLWGNKEDVTYDIPKNVNPNFAFVDDGDVIASSNLSESEALEGTFYFKDEDKRQSYRGIIENLVKGSVAFDEFAKTRTPLTVVVLKQQASAPVASAAADA